MSENEDLITNETSPWIRCRYCGQAQPDPRLTVVMAAAENLIFFLRMPLIRSFPNLNKDPIASTRTIDAHLQRSRAMPPLDSALKKLLAVTGESAIRVIPTPSAVKPLRTQCPQYLPKTSNRLHDFQRFDMPEPYLSNRIQWSTHLRVPSNEPVIVLYSQLIERLSDEEVLAVVAHEVGHVDFTACVVFDRRSLDRVFGEDCRTRITVNLTHRKGTIDNDDARGPAGLGATSRGPLAIERLY